ncbi:hypothetical protein [Pedobacter sp. N23S346]|uniref:hypothetical protein n=1 Tax=Pedobacter sp. N23S346 TaxID=3402750 RepID=UPI003ACB4154
MNHQQLLANLLAQPGKVGPEHVPMLQELAVQFPYAQPIHLLLAKADASFIPKAALYSHGNALFHVLNMVSVREETASFEEEIEEKEEIEAVVPVSDEENIEIVKEEISVEPAASPVVEPATSLPKPNLDFPAEEELFIESIATTDFFAFEQKLSTDVVRTAPVIETVVPDSHDVNFVSKYDDDQLPYTFLWWLSKTRKEHEQIFQPYVQQKPAVIKSQPIQQKDNAEFQQQYVEHIFHIQTPFEVADHLAEYPSADVKDAKGAEIIEKFLKEDPTIKPPKPEQIDNENKAKKSAEDRYDLVSETLAKIYIEQMLYHKAIDTYKKLSLKYPEKSGYFADLIQSIEKKF